MRLRKNSFVVYSKNMAFKFELNTFCGGISDFDDKGIKGAFKHGKNLDIRKQVDSLSSGQDYEEEGLASSQSPSLSVSPSATPSLSPSLSLSPSASVSPSPSPSTGESASPSLSPSESVSPSASISPSSSISPSPSPTAGLTTVFEDLIRFFVKCSDGYTYGFGNTGCIYRRDSAAFWQRVYKDSDGAIKGAEEMPASGGKTYLGWCTNTKVKRKPIPGLSNFNDVEVVAQNLQSQDWHTMKQVGGATKIANGSFLAMVGYDESFTNEAVDFIPGTIIKTLLERDGRVISSEANAAIDCEYPLAQIGTDGEIVFADGNNSTPVKRFPGGGKVNPGGVCNEIEQVNFFEWEETALSWIAKQSVGNLALFAVYDADEGYGGIYSYGRKNKNKPFALNLDYNLDVDELGAIANVEGTTLVSYRDGTDYGVMARDDTAKATGEYYSLDLKAPTKKPGEITVWDYAEVFCSPLVNGSSIKFYYKINKTGDWIQAKMEGGGTEYSTALGKKAVFLIADEGEIFETKIVLTPVSNSSVEIFRILVFGH